MTGTRGGGIDGSPRKRRSRTCDLRGRLGRRASTASTSAGDPDARAAGSPRRGARNRESMAAGWKALAEVVWGS